MVTTLNIEGMTCGHCKARVEKALSEVDGVISVEVILASKQAIVTSNQAIEANILIEAVDEAGYDVISIE